MKQKTIITAALVLLSMSASAQSAQYVKLQPFKAKAADNYPVINVVDEDFSLMTKGSDTAPDAQNLSPYGSDNYPYLPNEYFHQPGWWGMKVYQAGGAVALNGEDGVGGVLTTPAGDYSGELTITFRAKAVGTEPQRILFVTPVKGGAMNPKTIGDNMTKQFSIRANSNWKTYTVNFTIPYGGNDGQIQFNCTMGGIIIDDVHIEKKQSLLAAPILNPAKDFTYSGFTASWSKVAMADKYLMTLYRYVPISDVDSVNINEDFSQLDVTGNRLNQYGYDEQTGCTFNIGSGERDVFTEGEPGCISAPYSICLDNDNDTIVFPYNGGYIKHFVTSIRKVKTKDDDEAKIYIDIFDGAKWVTFTSFYVNSGIPDGDAKLLLDYFLQSKTFYQVRLRCKEFGNETQVAIDNLEMTTTTPTRKDVVYEDRAVNDTAVVLTDLDPESDYYYYAKAQSTEYNLTSNAPEDPVYAFGVSAPKANEASDVDDRGGYTASWSRTPKATSYQLNTYDTYTATSDVKSYAVLKESFSASNQGTTTEPILLNNYFDLVQLDQYTDNPGWYGYITAVAKGAIGCEDGSSMSLKGELQSPELDLSHNGGQYTIRLTVSGYEGEYLIVQNNAGDRKAVEITEDEQTFDIPMEHGTVDDILTFYTYEGRNFMVSNVEVLQDLSTGDKVSRLASVQALEGNNSTEARISGLDDTDNTTFGYDVQAVYAKGSRVATSTKSNRVAVDVFGTGVRNITADNANTGVEIFDCSGSRVFASSTSAKLPTGLHGTYIVKRNGKSVKIMFK